MALSPTLVDREQAKFRETVSGQTAIAVVTEPSDPNATATEQTLQDVADSLDSIEQDVGTLVQQTDQIESILSTISDQQTDGSQKSQQVDEEGNVQPAGDVVTRPVFVKPGDGTTSITVKPASTAASATDTSEVVALSPNTPLPAGTNLLGKVGIDQTIQGTTNGIVRKHSTAISYSAVSTAQTVPSTPTDIFTIYGSASKTIKINSIEVSGTQTNASSEIFRLIKRSTANTGGGLSSLVQFVQFTETANTTTAVITVTSTGAGNLIVIGAMNSDNRNVSSISDGTSNFTQAANAAGGSGAIKSDIWYLLSSNAGKTTFTVTFSGTSTTKGISFWEISGTGAAVFDVGNRVNNGVGATTESGPALTVVSPSFIAAIINTNGTITASPAAGNSFTSGGGINSFGDGSVSLITGSVGPHTPQWTDSGSTTFASSAAAFTFAGNVQPEVISVPHDSTNAAASAKVYTYFANPTLGTAVGTVRSAHVNVSTVAGVPIPHRWDFSNSPGQPIVLRGTSQSLNINLGGDSMVGSSLCISIDWSEES